MAKEVSKQREPKAMKVSEVLIKYHRIPEAGDHLCPRKAEKHNELFICVWKGAEVSTRQENRLIRQKRQQCVSHMVSLNLISETLQDTYERNRFLGPSPDF